MLSSASKCMRYLEMNGEFNLSKNCKLSLNTCSYYQSKLLLQTNTYASWQPWIVQAYWVIIFDPKIHCWMFQFSRKKWEFKHRENSIARLKENPNFISHTHNWIIVILITFQIRKLQHHARVSKLCELWHHSSPNYKMNTAITSKSLETNELS